MTPEPGNAPPATPRLPGEGAAPFQGKPMVDWLHPAELARTAIKVAVSSVFGEYADKRELEAALHPLDKTGSPYDADYSAETGQDFWLDYVADLGDGFDATYSIAWLLSRPALTLPGETVPLPRGRMLALGGDQVYPFASREEYQHRFRGPYEAAFPGKPGEGDPDMFATPGNHDWYDGLTSFTRLFCQKRGIGRWRTRQTRSYFAIKLPHRWWLWGIDIQLGADIDRPQMEFFQCVAEHMARECAGGPPPRLILGTGQPAWTGCGAEQSGRRDLTYPDPKIYDNLAFFEEQIIRRHGIELKVALSGDLHHYMRYTESSRQPRPTGDDVVVKPAPRVRANTPIHRITSGGGGAYLYPTHHMPETIELPEGQEQVKYQQKAAFPNAAESRRLARRVYRLPAKSIPFALFLAAIYTLFAWTLQSASKAHPIGCGTDGDRSLMECIESRTLGGIGDVALAFLRVLQHSPANVVFALVVIYGLYKFRATEGPANGNFWGALHGVMHVILSFAMIWVLSIVNLHLLGLPLDDLRQAGLFLVEMLVGGGILGSGLFAFYLWLSSRKRGSHLNEVFSSQRIADYKNFLRMNVRPDGSLAIHAIGVPAVPKGNDWRPRPADAGPRESLFMPPNGQIPIVRIDGPIESD